MIQAALEVLRKSAGKFALAAILATLAIFANFITVRRIGYYAVEASFYDELSVAYSVGGAPGLKNELAKIAATAKLQRRVDLAKEFSGRLEYLADPKEFIGRVLSEDFRRIMLLRRLRTAAFLLILAILGLRVIANFRGR